MDTRKEKIRETISDLKDNGFIQTLDKVCTYSENADLYFMKVKGSENKFVVVNHYGKGLKDEYQWLDLWLSTFENQEDIGRKHPIANEMVKRHFDTESDFEILKRTLYNSANQ